MNLPHALRSRCCGVAAFAAGRSGTRQGSPAIDRSRRSSGPHLRSGSLRHTAPFCHGPSYGPSRRLGLIRSGRLRTGNAVRTGIRRAATLFCRLRRIGLSVRRGCRRRRPGDETERSVTPRMQKRRRHHGCRQEEDGHGDIFSNHGRITFYRRTPRQQKPRPRIAEPPPDRPTAANPPRFRPPRFRSPPGPSHLPPPHRAPRPHAALPDRRDRYWHRIRSPPTRYCGRCRP